MDSICNHVLNYRRTAKSCTAKSMYVEFHQYEKSHSALEIHAVHHESVFDPFAQSRAHVDQRVEKYLLTSRIWS